jgi:DNA-binding MarR family transcriptional regulator
MTREPPGDSLGEQLGAVARRLRAASMASLAAWDVTPAQMRAIRILTGPEAGVRSSELARHLHIAPRSATEVIDALEAKGLVERSPDPTDRRATLVALTPKGLELSGEVHRARGQESDKLFERLSEADRAHLARILSRLQSD